MLTNSLRLCSNQPVNAIAYIALGSNMGDRDLNLLRAVAEIGRIPGTRITALSSFYDTEPVGGVEQENFLNAVARIETVLFPHELLEELQRIETAIFGRTRDVRWGPRTMDLDLLLYNDTVQESDTLTIPHPRLHQRRFVLEPLTEIAPDLVHPRLGATIDKLLKKLPVGERVTKLQEGT